MVVVTVFVIILKVQSSVCPYRRLVPPDDVFSQLFSENVLWYAVSYGVTSQYVWVPAESLGRSSAVGIATTLRAGWCGVQIPVGAGDSSVRRNVQTGSGVLHRGRGVNLTSHLKLVPRLIMSGSTSVPLLPLHALVAWAGRTLPLLDRFAKRK